MTEALSHLTSIQFDQHLECLSAVINMKPSPYIFWEEKYKRLYPRKHAVNLLIQHLSFPYNTGASQMDNNLLFMDQLTKKSYKSNLQQPCIVKNVISRAGKFTTVKVVDISMVILSCKILTWQHTFLFMSAISLVFMDN